MLTKLQSIKDQYIHRVPATVSAQRLQEYGVGVFEAVPTKSALKKALKKQLVWVNDTVATTATMIKGGETIALKIAPATNHKTKLVLELEVLYQDEYLAAIYKPAGILVSGNSFKTITNALPQNLKPSPLEDATRPQPVHRLDYATTGVLLIGKTSESIRRLNKMFQLKQIGKTYYAIVIGDMKPQGSIDTAIDGKTAVTKFECLQTVSSPRFGSLSLVKLSPKTGRRHQLRKHLSEMGNPILGDRDYSTDSLLLKGKGIYLHAFQLAFTHPFTEEYLSIKAHLPKKFKKIFY